MSSRLAIVLSHPIQYYSPWFRWMAGRGGVTLKVFYLWEAGVKPQMDPKFRRAIVWDTDLLSGYEHEFVPNLAKAPATDRFAGLKNPGLRRRLQQWAPDAILLFGYAYRTHLQLILNPPAPLIFRGDSHLLGGQKPGMIKRITLRVLYSRFKAVTYVGQANRNYFRFFGVPDSRLQFVPHCVDADHYTPDDEKRVAAARLRVELGLTGKRVILFAGKLVSSKQPVELLEAFFKIATSQDALVFVGEGEQKADLIKIAATRPEHTVRFLPFSNQSEMPVRYLLSDIFVLPSRGFYETWGLAVNEAMHMGVPCIVSDRVGCQLDLVTEGETGWVFRLGEPDGLTKALSRALQADRSAMRADIAQRIGKYTYRQATAGMLSALCSVDQPEETGP